jgi:2-dehydro-3-deoxyphosphogluconate aldolase/(4S)-4-hydroxy-2-oxoglutarate aldolase
MTTTLEPLLTALLARPVIVVLRGFRTRPALVAALALAERGLRAVEITMDSPAPGDTIRELRRELPDEVVVGAGTVLTDSEFAHGVEAGAQFAVSPIWDGAILQLSAASGVPFIPGVLSPTEIAMASRSGAAMVKVFPAGPLEPSYLRALRGPLGSLAVMVSGGIRAEAVPSWIEAGATAVGLGLSPVTDDLESVRRAVDDLIAGLSMVPSSMPE